MDGLPEPRVKETLINHGFQPTKPQPTKGSWQTFKHPDGSKVDIHWSTGRIVRTEAPIYGEDGSRINRGQRLDSQGNRIPLEIRHEQHPKETVDNSGV